MFEKATRMKLRFNYKGVCSVEDLWDVPLRDLDAMYRSLTKQKRDAEGDSLLETRDRGTEVLTLQTSIIKHVVEVRLQERKDIEEASAKAAKKQKILSIIAEKQDQSLRDMSEEDLANMVNSL